MRKLAIALPAMLLILALAAPALSTPGSFSVQGEETYDNWGVCRTQSWGDNGFFQITETTFRPAIAFESLGELENVAWEVGQRLVGQYSDRNQLAQQIFSYAQNHVRYTSDLDQFGVDEFARNADEMVENIESTGWTRGDCEDYAVLLAVMYRAAGFRSAVVLAPGHAAALVHLPDYPGANTYWNFEGTSGWVWAEATGRTNPLGWTPPDFMRSDMAAYEVVEGENIFEAGGAEVPTTVGGSMLGFSPFFSMIFFLWLLSAFRRR